MSSDYKYRFSEKDIETLWNSATQAARLTSKGETEVSFQKPTQEQLENRYTYHAPKDDQPAKYQRIRHLICELAKECVFMTPCSSEQSLALNALDQAMFLFNAAIARHE